MRVTSSRFPPIKIVIMFTILSVVTIWNHTNNLAAIKSWTKKDSTRQEAVVQSHNIQKPKIAIISSYIDSDMWSIGQRGTKLKTSLDHIINRACYSHQWNYDFIFNQTQELSLTAADVASSGIDRWWLKFGCWERVAHLQAALPSYDWVLYSDLDYIIKDLSRPIESFLREFDLYGKNEVHVLVPEGKNWRDVPTAFSSFAVLVKNSPFGRKLLENWRAFAMGICPLGNFASADNQYNYEWRHSDQPGLWYALMKTHMDFFPNNALPPSIVQCNATSGLIDDSKTGPHLGFGKYFQENGFQNGNYGNNLHRVPDNQPIIFSKSGDDYRSGIGVENNWGKTHTENTIYTYAFALHHNAPSHEWNPTMQQELDLCKSIHGCYARLNLNNLSSTYEVDVKCGNESKAMHTFHEFRNKTHESTPSFLANSSILPIPTSDINTSVITLSLVNQTFSAIRDELTLPTGCIPMLHQMIVGQLYPELIQYTKESDTSFRRDKLGKARKLLTDKNATDVALQLSSEVTFDLVGIDGASRPGSESMAEALRYWNQLKGCVEKFLELEGTIAVEEENEAL